MYHRNSSENVMEVYPDGVWELVYALSANWARLWDREDVEIKLRWAESDKKQWK